MAVRTRTQSQVCPVRGSGHRYLFADYYYDPGEIEGSRATCHDEVDGTREPHALDIEHRLLNVEPLNGSVYVNQWSWREYNQMRPGWATTALAQGCPELLPDLDSLNARAIRVVNGSNPSRASVDIGVTLAELREAPQLIFRAGSRLLTSGANAFLQYKFGWEPMVNDIMDCFKVQDHVDKRINELQRLASNGGLRRKIMLDDDYRESTPSSTFLESSMGDVFMGELQRSSRRRSWGTCRWVPSPPSPFTAGDYRMRARRAVYGAHADASTAWALMPWTWMFDWFGNLGDFIQTSRNTVGAERQGPVSLMVETTHRDFYSRTSGPVTVTGGSGSVETVTKTRRNLSWFMPEFQMPFIGSGRLSILGALGVGRIPNRELPTLAEALGIWIDNQPRRPRRIGR